MSSSSPTWIWSEEHRDYYYASWNPNKNEYDYVWGNIAASENEGSEGTATVETTYISVNTSGYATTVTQDPLFGRRETFFHPQYNSTQLSKRGRVYDMRLVDNPGGGRRERKDTSVSGNLHGILVKAFPDSCSSLDMVSEEFLYNQGFLDYMDTSNRHGITLPTGRLIGSVGSITLHFSFQDDSEVHMIKFSVLRNCVHEVVLSSGFLYRTETLTKYKNRLQRTAIESRLPRMCLVGTTNQDVMCRLNGHPISAAPDSGSEVMAMSRSFVVQLGLFINEDRSRLTTLEFMDGSREYTCGMVHDVKLQFGGHFSEDFPTGEPTWSTTPSESLTEWQAGTRASSNDAYLCSFHVVDNLICPVILSAEFLYSIDAFDSYRDSFRTKRNQYSDEAFGVQDTKEPPKWLPWGSNTSQAQTITLTPAQIESNRRMEADDYIASLPQAEQAAARQAETLKRQQWDQLHGA